MKPAAFDYVRCDTSEEALAVLSELGEDARVLAGGQSLMAVLNMRLATPRVLVDISRVPDLNYVRAENGTLAIGAAVTQAYMEHRVTLVSEVPLLSLVLPHVAHVQIRNRGTVCGSIAHADPSAELPLALACLGGQVVLRSRRGRRVLGAEAFVLGMLMTARTADELIEEVRFPLARPEYRYAFTEFTLRHGDFAIVACAAVATPEYVRLAVGGVSDRPRVAQWPRSLAGDADDLSVALNDFAWALEAQDDAYASAGYRRHLVRVLGRQVLTEVSR